MRRRIWPVVVLTGAALAASAPAHAATACGGPPPLLLFEFEPGSAELPADAVQARAGEIRERAGNSELLAYSVLAMGDISQGPAWEAASTAERLADQTLARERGAGVSRLLQRLPWNLRKRVTARLIPNRLRRVGETRLSERTGAVVEIGMHYRDANGIYIAC